MGISALIGGVGSVIGGLVGSSGAKKAAKTQAAAADKSSDNQMAMLDKELAYLQPFHDMGVKAQGALATGLGLTGQPGDVGYNVFSKPFTMSDFQADPGYQFRMDQGMKALQASAAARGNLLSGSTLKGIQDYSQGLAGEEYQNAFNRYQTQRNTQINALNSLANQGIGAAGQGVSATENAGNNISNNITGAGEAQASGYVGGANAIAGGISGAANSASNYFSGNSLLKTLGAGGLLAGRGGAGAYGVAGSDGIY